MKESLNGDDNALKELKFNAGSGDCEAQYYLALYYAKTCGHLHDPNYHYWLEKSKENGYVPGVGITIKVDDSVNMVQDISWSGINMISHLVTLFSLLL